MAAAAFTGTLILENMSTKQRKQVRVTFSDVAAAFGIFPSGENILTLPSDANYSIVDLILSAAGTDTTNMDLYVNQNTTGIVVNNASNVGTVYNRQFQMSPVDIRGGSTIRFTQRA